MLISPGSFFVDLAVVGSICGLICFAIGWARGFEACEKIAESNPYE